MSNEEIQALIDQYKEDLKKVVGSECEVWARIVGYARNTKNFNYGKQQEYTDRTPYKVPGKKDLT